MTRSALVVTILWSLAAAGAQPPPPGAALDPLAYAYVREIPAGSAGLVAVPLDAPALAHSRGPDTRFADLRIVDPQNRQLPYLLEQRDGHVDLAVSLQALPAPAERTAPAHRSVYLVRFPYTGLPDADLELRTSQPTFRREVQIAEEHPADRRSYRRSGILATRIWQHADAGTDPPPLLLPIRIPELDAVVLTIDEGDNAPLPITSATLRLPSWRIRFYRPEGTPVRLLYGNRDATMPEYDLALARERVMSEAVVGITAGPERLQKKTAAILSPRVFWGFLIAAVAVLLALIVRLATSRTSEDRPPPSAPRP